jgi:hypothetical protein
MPFGTFKWSSVVATGVAALLLLATSLPPAAAMPYCVATRQVLASNIRSEDERGILINVYGDTLAGAGTLPASAANDINDLLVSTNQVVKIESVAHTFDATAQVLFIFVRNESYEIYRNDTLEVTLPGYHFDGGIACPTFHVSVVPSQGLITADLPFAPTEMEVNSGDLDIIINVQHDMFVTASFTLLDHVHAGLHLIGSLLGGTPSRSMRIRILKNESFNLAFGDSVKLTFAFPKSIMRTGLEASLGELAFGPISLTITGMKPLVSIDYFNTEQQLRSEDVWDGRARVALVLEGDQWILNKTLWMDPATRPSFAPSRPVQKYGWDYFLNRGMLPSVEVTSRRVYLTFPPMPGFTLSNTPVTQLEVSGFDNLATEHTAISVASIRVVQAQAQNVRVTWSGGPFSSRSLTEADMRRVGFSLIVSIKYNIFPSPPSLPTVKTVFVSATSGQFSTDGLDATVKNLTHLHITIPPMTTYDITKNDIVNVTVPASLTETNVQPSNPRSGFVINTFTGASQCDISTPIPLDETNIRDTSGPPLNITLSIVTGMDSFCYTSDNMRMLTDSVSFTSTSPGTTITLTPVLQTPTSIVFDVPKDPNFQINSDNFVSLTIPKELMCSLEYCRNVRGVSGSAVSLMQLAIATTPGTLIATFPQITEVDMRATSYQVELYLSGDSFAIKSASQFIFNPQFVVTPTDVNRRAFLASIRNGIVATVTSANKSRALMTIPRNESYDTAQTERITVVIDPSLTESQLRPQSEANDMVISVVTGNIVASVASNTSVREVQVLNGTFSFSVTLVNDLWASPAIIGNDLRNTATFRDVASSRGVQAQLDTYLSDAAITVNTMRSIATIAFRPTPEFDILVPEEFSVTFSGDSTASGLVPRNNTFTFVIMPDNGTISISGSATFAGTLDVVNGGLSYQLWLSADLWSDTADFVREDFCLLSDQCSIILNRNNYRQVTVLFDRNPAHSPAANETRNVILRPEYFLSGSVPIGNPSLFLYVTSGVVIWTLERSVAVVTENMIREGSLPHIKAGVNGDRYSVDADVRGALVAGVRCTNARNVSDEYGFCARAATLFQGLDFSVANGQTMRLQLQPDELYDIYEPETVTLYLGPTAFQSRLAPNRSYSFTFTVQPTRGTFYLSGTLNGLTQSDVTDATKARRVAIAITLRGERWLPNASNAVSALIGGLTTTAEVKSLSFVGNARRILNPEAAGTLDPTRRVLTLRFVPVPTFSITGPEFVSISVPQDAVLSSFAPDLASVASGFGIGMADGKVSVSPAQIDSADIRSTGVNVTFFIAGAAWRIVTFESIQIADYIQTSSSPIDEPKGFAVFRDALLKDAQQRAVSTSAITLPIARTPDYDLNRPEAIYLVPDAASWIVENVPTDPRRILIRFDPSYPYVEVVVDVGNVNGTVDMTVWMRAVATSLGLMPEDILVSDNSPHAELYVPQPSRYRRISFRVKYYVATDPKGNPALPMKFDNSAAKVFLSLDRGYGLRSFNAVTTFFNSSPPDDRFWTELATGQAVVDEGPTIGASTIYLLSFSGAIILVFLGVYAWIRYNKGKNKTSLRWDPTSAGGAGDDQLVKNRDVDDDEDMEALKKTADVLYAGQRAEVPVARTHNALEQSVSAAIGDLGRVRPSETKFRTAVQHHVPGDDDDDVAGLLDVPALLYSGQSSTVEARRREQGIREAGGYSSTYQAPSLLDRLDRAMQQQHPNPLHGRQHPSAPRPHMASPCAAGAPPPTVITPEIDDFHSVLFPDEAEALAARQQREEERERANRVVYYKDAPYRPPRSKFSNEHGYSTL